MRIDALQENGDEGAVGEREQKEEGKNVHGMKFSANAFGHVRKKIADACMHFFFFCSASC